MRGLLLASFVLLWPLTAGEPHRANGTWCDASGACYSAHLGKVAFREAEAACAGYGGGLSTASGRPELRALLALLEGVANGAGGGLFWLGLSRKGAQCTREELPLRGFSWSSWEAANDTSSETPLWLREPVRSCTKRRCAGLHVSRGQPWGLVEQACTAAAAGYLCKYRYEGTCAALSPAPGARRLRYTLPSRLHQSPAVEFSPPGTVLALGCSAGQEARFVCRLSPDGYHWEGAGHGLCSCPSGLWSPAEGACAPLGACRSARGAFLCLCVRGSRLEATEEACAEGLRAADAANGTAGPGLAPASTSGAFGPAKSTSRPAQNSSWELFPRQAGNGTSTDAGADQAWASPDSSNYVFILVTVAVVLLVILVMAALQVFQACFRVCSSAKRSQAKKDRAPDAAAAAAGEGDLDVSATCTHSENSLGPSKAESGEVSPDDPMPGDGPLDLGQP
ncbi:hypothetical protein JRQ81_000920 [Phrynocephalus forsythii]|uniref:C-type lectin domain-containing protein n=1 Tax=Phrynocephalus forsythii TaxID=171643 RepID=A0A9Q1B8D5_9SAUR|nr:hypothetical protein JRQ81_000920 [Phrynocephalus forsythii]